MDALKTLPWKEAFGQKHVMLTPATRGYYNDIMNVATGLESVLQGNPDDPGYLVKYVDSNDYISWSPKDVANAAYRLNGKLACGHALNAVMEGKVAVRAKWIHDDYLATADIYEPKYRWIALGSGNSALEANKFWNEHSKAQAVKNGGFLAVDPYFIHFNGNAIVMGWLPNHEDAIATDWCVLDSIAFDSGLILELACSIPD